MKRLLALAISAACLACAATSDNSPYGDVSGSIDDTEGNSFQFNDAAEGDTIQASGTSCDGTAQESTLLIELSSRVGVCAARQDDTVVASNEVLQFSIVGSPAASGGAAPGVAAGIYPIGGFTDMSGNTYVITASLGIFDALCGQEDLFATAGTVEIDSLDGGEAIGEFVLDFGDTSNSLSGSFDTHDCPISAAERCPDAGPSICTP